MTDVPPASRPPDVPSGREEGEVVRRATLVRIVWYTCLLGVIWAALHMYLGILQAAIPVLVYILLSGFNVLAYQRSGRFGRFRTLQLVLILLLPFATQVFYGGFVSSGAIMLSALLAPTGALLFHRVSVARALFGGFAALIVLAGVLEWLGLVADIPLTPGVSLFLFVNNVLFTAGTLFFMFDYFVRQRNRLNELVLERNAELTEALRQLEEAKDRLVQQEKLAALGQLTAGIAHEIKNPLNFVNNFASLSCELMAELGEETGPKEIEAILATSAPTPRRSKNTASAPTRSFVTCSRTAATPAASGRRSISTRWSRSTSGSRITASARTCRALRWTWSGPTGKGWGRWS